MNPYALMTIFSGMSRGSRVTGALMGGGTMTYLVYMFFGRTGMLIMIVGVVALTLILGIYGWIVKKARRRKAAKFGSDMKGQSAATPQGVNQAGQIAMLDDMRKKFEEGVEKFKVAGKDIYDLPWYMIVGEPGSGKTEAIRHSNIGFPPGLQDELQGVGGTINMNWWVTNDAVILDLAGRLMFSDLETGEGEEWTTFLKLLKKHRPNCPVNGLLLVIPADSLIKDTPDEIQSKATKISQQLSTIQRTLDIRFPVFVAITKCDLVVGFREFFDDIDNPDLQGQMLGWSNPDSIDDPFNPAKRNEYLDIVKDGLLRRRLHLLQNPEPCQDLSDSRFDEVDTLYDFPRYFETITKPLKQYMQTVFVPSEWSTKPLFLRGIYFTSSMREGAALDEELARTLGIEPEQLPEGRIWERDRAFFLKDVFLKKIFPESGLVTRATNVRRMHLRRKLTILGTATAGILLLFLLTWLGGRKLQNTIGRESRFWKFAANRLEEADTDGDHGLAIVSREATNATAYAYQGNAKLKLELESVTLGRYHRDLQRLIQHPIQVPAIFRLSRPFDAGFDKLRRHARRVLFDLSVLQPAVEAARHKVSTPEMGGWNGYTTAALGELVRIEADALKLPYDSDDKPEGPIDLDALLQCVLSNDDFGAYDARDREVLNQVLLWSYSLDGGKADWVPDWLVTGHKLDGNPTLDTGVDRFIEYCVESPEMTDLEAQLKMIMLLWQQLDEFEKARGKEYKEAEARFIKFFGDQLPKFERLYGFMEAEKEWRSEYELLQTANTRLCEVFSAITNDYMGIAICQGRNAAQEYRTTVSNALDTVSTRFKELPLPPEAAAPEATEEGDEADADTPVGDHLVDQTRDRMLAALDKVRRRFPDNREKELEEFVKLYAGIKARVDGYLGRFRGFGPVIVPDELKFTETRWKPFHTRIRETVLEKTHRELEVVVKKIDAAFASYEDVAPKEHEAAVKDIRRRAGEGLESIDSETFRGKCNDVLKLWSKYEGVAMPDRETILDTDASLFKRDYLIYVIHEEENYVQQYWDDLFYYSLKSIADELMAEVKDLIPGLSRYARFPLDLPRADVKDLALKEVGEAAEILKKLTPRPVVPNGKLIGEGAGTGITRIDVELERLRHLQLGDAVDWVNAANRMLACLPHTTDRAVTANVQLNSSGDQKKLLSVFNQGMEDCIMNIWRYGQVVQGSALDETRFSTIAEQQASVGLVAFPGPDVSFNFFTHYSDTVDPSRTVTYPGPWGVLHMLHQRYSSRVKSEPKKWSVQLSVIDPQQKERVLWFSIEFDKELPSKKEWPKRPASFR